MEKRKVTSEGYFRMLMILFAAMLMSQITSAAAMVYLDISNGLPVPNPNLQLTFVYALVAVGAAGLGASFLVVNALIAKAADKPTLAEKLRGFQTASIIRFAFLEAPSLLGIVGFLLTGQYLFFIATGVAVVAFLLFIPSKQKAIESLRLSGDEIRLLEDPNAVIMEVDVTTAD